MARAVESAWIDWELEAPATRPQIEVPRDQSHGDFSTNAAMVFAKSAKRPPREIAEAILEKLDAPSSLIESSPEIVGPGFINFRVAPAAWLESIPSIIEAGEKYGCSDIGAGERVMVEFVSANPTGPLHIGHARNAAIGDTYARILDTAGYNVSKEFYINDAGNQVETLAKTVHARRLEKNGVKIEWEKTFPDGNYYPGDYVLEIAENMPVSEDEKEAFMKIPPGGYDPLERRFAVEKMLNGIKKDLADFRVEFDVWFSEYEELYKKDLSREVMEKLRDQDDIYEKDDAVWFKVAKYEPDEEDRVVKKSTGEWTYFASDIAYHWEKLRRGFERLVNVWGADHHGYIGRVRASLQALGLSPDKLEVLLVQMVNLVRGGEPVRMGKRTGEFITLREVMDEVGADAMRFTFLTRSSNSHLDFDIDILKAKPGEDSELKMSQLREKNPVYYVQYAHARAKSIFRKAIERGSAPDSHLDADLSLLTLPEEIGLARKIEGFPREVAISAANVEPHRISHYLIEVAGDFHRYYYLGDRDPLCRVITDDMKVRGARLALVAAVAQVIRNGLRLLGVEAPERM